MNRATRRIRTTVNNTFDTQLPAFNPKISISLETSKIFAFHFDSIAKCCRGRKNRIDDWSSWIGGRDLLGDNWRSWINKSFYIRCILRRIVKEDNDDEDDEYCGICSRIHCIFLNPTLFFCDES